MPRRNRNADYHRPRHQFNGRILFLNETPKPMGLKVDAETIVREFRKNWKEKEARNEILIPVYRSSSIVHRFFRAINWDVVFEYACWAAVIGCLIYLGIFVFAPFGRSIISGN